MPLIPETWLDSQTVNTTTSGSQTQPSIVQLANGNILITWTTDDASGLGAPAGTEVFAQLYDPLGVAIGTEFRINQASTLDNERNSDVVALPGGGFIVIYHDADITGLGGSNIRLEEFDAAGFGVSSSSVVISDSGMSGLPNYANPRGAASSDTSVLIVYDKVDGANSGVYGKIYNPSTDTYGTEILILLPSGGVAENADATALTNGNYVIVSSVDAADDYIRFRILDSAGVSVFGAANVAGTDNNTERDFEPSVTALTGGGFVITYSNTDVNDTDVVYRIFNAAGAETGSGLITNASTANDNNEPVVTGLADGSFIIAYDNDVANTGVVAHIGSSGVQLGEFEFTGPITQLAITSLADGRFAVTYLFGSDIQMEILDTRDIANGSAYSPIGKSIGTIGDDLMTVNADEGYGFTGNDSMIDGLGLNSMFGGEGNDFITISAVDSMEVVDGGAGIDTLIGNAMNDGVTYDLAAQQVQNGVSIETATGFEHVIGTSAAEILVGSNIANSLTGGGGDDSLNGGFGFDTTIGGSGNDTYFVSAIGDVIVETAGNGTNDRVIASGAYILGAGVDVERLSASNPGGVGAINLFGNELSQTISGNNGINVLSSGAAGGSDTLRGFAGDDIYRVFNAGDVIVEGVGEGVADRVSAAVSFELAADDDIEFMSASVPAAVTALDLTGNAFSQSISGNAGANILSTGGGAVDTLTGLGGADVYRVFNTGDIIVEGVGGGIDRVAAAVDFNLAADDDIETLATNGVAGVSAIDLRGNALAQSVQGNNGANILNGLGGSDTLTGGLGTDTFVFNSALGLSNSDIITDYTVVDDHFLLENSIFIGLAAGVLAASAFSSSIDGIATDASDRIMYETDTGFVFFDQDGNAGGFARIRFADLASGLAMTAAEFTVV
jgi:Ca2+-binding RTX toxin-like protein